MRVEIEGLQQGSIEVELQSIPRIGETVKVMYGADAEVKGEVTEVNHYINQHANEHKVILTIRPLFSCE
ncbi:hypothetical protein [Acinetobacter gerneri]|uniref:KOW domain-containing protein n=2 Tax=Acinetobacter gerneri TaxID=202952 RepID=N8ZJZ3_9GAMM|nr:hypothetical protein [Acinetobacter gerneri]ENV32053.1 hypothetical protein F960_03438 [Acinetobacter gerneri DSM 14967 = CIP 107464 = MTCC 9824]EPR83646.1 hypothetical protein L289_2015 [Acinetobacter gerneri DSM 14967 = CIP 107464 = MTCC 9824]MDQ9009356.1 hypothetical protein [Acinetobacter gerneri]MDQ9013442.1 hypothetical protein [Acinetobacter gerneri]MDQ9024724.1 hypothetical protein [Acinetobacter gerneri]